MGKDCCDVKVTEIDNGYRIEVTGEDIKGKCKDTCCSPDDIKKCFQSCCEIKK